MSQGPPAPHPGGVHVTLLDLVIILITGLTSSPLDSPVESCSFEKRELCCTWHYQEVGCYEEFTIEEKYCISAASNYTWEIADAIFIEKVEGETWHDRYVRDHCAACPECCVSEGDDDEDE